LLIGIVAVVFAFLAAWLLSPGGAGYGFSVPDAGSYFGAGELHRIEHYRSQSRLIAIGSLLLTFVVLAFLAWWRGRPVLWLLNRFESHPILGAGVVGIVISLILTIVDLPLAWLSFNLGRDIGLFTQTWTGWLGDQALSALISAVIAGIGALIVMALWRKFRGYFWIPASLLIGLYALITVWLWPVLVAPLFNDFTPVPEGHVRSQVLDLADREGIDVGQVYLVDASKRSTAINAYVNGVGSTKRVVLYDNAIKDLNDAEFSSLVAHELGHVKSNDVYRGLAFALLVIPLGALFVQLATVGLARRREDDLDGPGVIPALALFATVAALVLGVPGNVLSRNIEAHADRADLQTTNDPQGLIGLQRELARTNLADPDPPGAFQFLFGTHPSTMQRIGAAVAWPENDPEGSGK